MGTAGYRAAPDPGWRVTPTSAATGGFPLPVRYSAVTNETSSECALTHAKPRDG
jgi:hypothetical protein